MATGSIDLDDTADPAIETLADTPCDLCGAPLDCGEYVTRIPPQWMRSYSIQLAAIRYLHQHCADRDDEACGGL